MNMDVINHKIVKNRIGLLNLAQELGDVSKACRIMGYSRDTFYRYKAAKEEGGVKALFDANRRKPNLKNRVDEATEKAVTEHAIEYPAEGQTRASNELRKKGVFVSPSGVRSIWLRHGLECFSKRLKALEMRTAETGAVLTEGSGSGSRKKEV